ncbi:transmembrane protein 134-like isoform X1 [Lineus longissimus]|uniref:transmembrane protein 134-like isoform X1 n=1 Tax=Lineus longissimus TaxID=88925 RepID=UPI002B4D5285
MASKQFTIDDAFESDDDDRIRSYGTNVETRPLQNKKLRNVATVAVQMQEMSPTRKSSESEAFIDSAETEDLLDGTTKSRPGGPIGAWKKGDPDESNGPLPSILTKSFPGKPSWLRHPRIRENWNVVLGAFLLLFLGIGLLIVGLAVEIVKPPGVASFIFFIIGVICLIPGAYHVVYIYMAIKGKRGFGFSNLTTFE